MRFLSYGPQHAPQHECCISTTCSVMLHNMAGNDYRSGRSVLHCVVDSSVYAALKCFAADRGRSVTDVVNELLALEVERNGYVGVGSADREGPSEEGGGVREVNRGGSRDAPERGVVGRGIDWDGILAAGLAAKRGVVVERVFDPIEEIA